MKASTYWGGAAFKSISGNFTINPALARVWSISATTGGLDVILNTAPDASRVGGPPLYILNIGANSFRLVASNGATTVPANNVAQVWLLPSSLEWHVIVRPNTGTIGSVTVPLVRPFVCGGQSLVATTCDVYSEVTAVWGAGSAIPNAKTEAAAMNLEAGAYFVGSHPVVAGVSEKNDELSPAGTWTNRTSCPLTTSKSAGAAVNGKGYIISGTGTQQVAEYVLDTWAVKSKAFPHVKTRGTAVGIAHRAYLISGEPVPTPNYLYDPVMECFFEIAYQPSDKRHSLASFAIDHLLYAVGGYRDSPLTRYDNCDEYNPVTDTWTVRSPLGAQRYRGCGIGGNSRGYYCGGYGPVDTAQAGTSSYNIDTWTNLAAMGTARGDIQNSGAAI